MEAYDLEKPVWSDEDFEIMGWHDATVWGMVQNAEEWEFLFDLDYIFKWVKPEGDETYFTFWVAPVTMVFENARDIKVHLESPQGHIEIADLHREELKDSPNGKSISYLYRFECHDGDISLRAIGFNMFVRKSLILLDKQSLDLEE